MTERLPYGHGGRWGEYGDHLAKLAHEAGFSVEHDFDTNLIIYGWHVMTGNVERLILLVAEEAARIADDEAAARDECATQFPEHAAENQAGARACRNVAAVIRERFSE